MQPFQTCRYWITEKTQSHSTLFINQHFKLKLHKRPKNSMRWANSEVGGYTEYNSEKVGWSETPAIAEIAATERFDCKRVPFRHANSKYGYKSLKN